jgi:hypothetical protein
MLAAGDNASVAVAANAQVATSHESIEFTAVPPVVPQTAAQMAVPTVVAGPTTRHSRAPAPRIPAAGAAADAVALAVETAGAPIADVKLSAPPRLPLTAVEAAWWSWCGQEAEAVAPLDNPPAAHLSGAADNDESSHRTSAPGWNMLLEPPLTRATADPAKAVEFLFAESEADELVASPLA